MILNKYVSLWLHFSSTCLPSPAHVFILTEMSPFTTGEAVRRTLEACALSAAASESTRWLQQRNRPTPVCLQDDNLCFYLFSCFLSMATAWPWLGLCPRVWHRTWASSGTQHPREVRNYTLRNSFNILQQMLNRVFWFLSCNQPLKLKYCQKRSLIEHE